MSSLAEYGLLWATFAAIMQWGLEAGIAAGVVAATLYFALGYAQSQLSAFSLAPGRSHIVRAADQEAALELLRPTHLVSAQVGGPMATVGVICLLGTAAPCSGTCDWCASCAAAHGPLLLRLTCLPRLLSQLRGFLFIGVANAISVRVHEVAQCLASGQGGEACGIGGSPVAAGAWSGLGPQQAQQADRLYAGSSKHDGALFASAAAPRFLLLDLSRWVGRRRRGRAALV